MCLGPEKTLELEFSLRQIGQQKDSHIQQP
jgi:hypothetical protein